MSEKRGAPRCPFCGALMQPKQELYGLESYGFNENDAIYWYECCNWKCGAHSPLRETAEEAYAVAVKLTQDWVSVADKLPESEMYVLGFNEKEQHEYYNLRFYPDAQEFCDDMYPGKPVSITHWMPYPDAPKEDEKDE